MKKFYALWHKQKETYLGFFCQGNSGHFCVNVSFTLDHIDDIPWVIDTYEQAEYVRTHDCPWYNAGYFTPQNRYNPEDLEIREITFP